MAENHCPPHYLHPTNQILQQITYNNFQIPNNIPQQQQQQLISPNNQITQLGFGHFYQQDQEQQQGRTWVDQQIINSAPSLSSLPSFPVNFGVGHNGNYGKGGGVLGEEEEEDGLLMRGSEQFGRSRNLTVANCWRNQEDSPSIKQAPPFGRPLLTEQLNENNKRRFEEVEEIKEQVYDQIQNKRFKHTEAFGNVLENNCRQVGNVEAIYEGNSTIEKTNETCQESVQDQLKAVNHDNENEEKSSDVKNDKDSSDIQFEPSMADFFNILTDRLIHHQDNLHQRFLKTIERLDEERKEREDEWRKQDLARLNQQAIDKANAQALASSREAAILSYLEKISGQSIMTSRNTHEKQAQEVISAAEIMNANKRWPKIEVEALIKIRTSLEPKFHDLALKAFVWEEISKLMGSMGYRRSAQRCKEKWENINRYYKKAKEQNPQRRKTCQYFQLLDQFYSSKSFTNEHSSSSSSFSSMLNGRNLFPLGIVGEIREKKEDKDDEEDEEEEDEEESDAD